MVDDSTQPLLGLRFSDFTARHIFTTKLRLVVLVGFWIVVAAFYPGLLTLDQPIMLAISLTFVLTTVCYAFILKGKWPVFFFVLELMSDVAAHTMVIYLTGGPYSNYFTIYIIYCVAGGMFYNYRVSAIIFAIDVFFYCGLLLALRAGWIPAFDYPFEQAGVLSDLGPYRNLGLLLATLPIAIYGIRIADHFTKVREEALERKNRELLALNRVSSMTRSAITLERVMTEVIRGVRDGMGYAAAFLFYHDRLENKVRLFVQEGTPMVEQIEGGTKKRLNEIYLPDEDQSNLLYKAMRDKRLIIRNDLMEVLRGMEPQISSEQAGEIQRQFGFQKFVAAPLVAEDKVLGALVGVSRDAWVEDEAIRAFEGFADQAALMIDNAMLIAELKQKNVELERVSRIKSDFLATMSHELRTPLTAIIGFSELLLEEVMGGMSADQKDSLREILANGENLLQLINGLLDLAKIEAGKMELSIGPVVVDDLMTRIQKRISSLLQKKRLSLSMDVDRSLPLIQADERKLQQVLLNLLSNAIKFTQEGGRIGLKARLVNDGAEGKDLEVSVSDTGVGIAEQDVKMIFESFRQLDSSHTREYQGTGLGLALVKELIEIHGGRVWVVSEVGKGSTFSFSIPVMK